MEIADVQVRVNNDEAKNRIKELTNEMQQLKEMRDKALKDGDTKAYAKFDAALKKLGREARKVEKDLFDVNKVLKNLSGASGPQLSQALRKLSADYRKLDRSSKDYLKTKAQYKRAIMAVRSELNKTNITMQKQGGLLKGLAGSFNQYFGMAAAFVATFTGTVMSVRKAAQVYNDYEESLDNLQSLTGLAANEMAVLDEQAKKTSTSVLDGGVRIKQGADQMLDAYTIIGSQRPELLKDADALHQVTLEAIILANAAKMDLGPAASALTNTMNQFQVGASETRRIINALAAGSQAGAGNIEYLSQSVEKFGTTAMLMNVPIEEGLGLIEAMAPHYSEARMAGNSLDKALLKLKSNNIGYTNGVFNMNQAIDELRVMYDNGTSATDIFGEEHAKMGELLVQNQGEFNRYTKMVTGSNKAIEQAAINTDNNNAKLAQAKNRLKLVTMELGQQLAPALTFSTNKFSYFVKGGLASINFLRTHRKVILLTTVAITSYTVAVNFQAIAYKGLSVWIKIADVATKAFNATTKMSPLGWIAALLTTAASAYLIYREKVNKTIPVQKKLNQELKRTNDLISETKSIEDKAKVMHTMNKRQLDDYKLWIQSQLQTEEDYRTQLMTKVKKRLDEDARLQELYEIRKSGYKTQFQAVATQAEINSRERLITGEYEDIAKANKSRIAQLRTYMTDVDKTIKGKYGNGGDTKTVTTDVLDKGWAERKMQLEKQNANEGLIDSVAKAKMLAEEVAYLTTKKQLLEKQGVDTLAIRQELHGKQLELDKVSQDIVDQYTDEEMQLMLEAEQANADEQIRINKATNDQLILAQKEFMSEQELLRQQERDRLLDNYRFMQGMSSDLGSIVGEALGDAEANFNNFGFSLVLMSLQVLKSMVPIWSAMILGYSLASPESVATWGAAGVAKHAALSALMYAGISTAEVAVKGGQKRYAAKQENDRNNSQGYYSGGYTGSGSDTEVAGPAHKNEWVSPAWMLRSPQIAPTIAKLEQARQNPALLNQVNPESGMSNTKLEELTTTILAMNAILEKGITAKIPLYGAGDEHYMESLFQGMLHAFETSKNKSTY